MSGLCHHYEGAHTLMVLSTLPVDHDMVRQGEKENEEERERIERERERERDNL
jgi:hypothetical protein